MFTSALDQENEYCALLTIKGIYSWKTEEKSGGLGFGPFNPQWDNSMKLWYLTKGNNKEYIIGVVHIHWDPFDENFSGYDGDFGFAQKLHGAPLFLFTANGDVKACCSPDGQSVGYIDGFFDKFTVNDLINCNQSLLNYCSK